MTWKDSLGLGVLMNTRGLVELVVLNAGLDLGVLSPALFTMMVLMALVTTFMTTPILILMKIQPSRGPGGRLRLVDDGMNQD
jgi:Kef-type K+ transport system membrane component KefB